MFFSLACYCFLDLQDLSPTHLSVPLVCFFDDCVEKPRCTAVQLRLFSLSSKKHPAWTERFAGRQLLFRVIDSISVYIYQRRGLMFDVSDLTFRHMNDIICLRSNLSLIQFSRYEPYI